MNTSTQGLRYTAAVDKRFKSSGPQPNGIQAADAGLWCIDQVDSKVYLLDWADGAVLQEFRTATEHSSGITLDGDGNVWITSTWQLEVVKIDPRTGRELARYPDPGAGLTAQAEQAGNSKPSGSHGIEWRAGRIYLAAPPTQRLHVMDAATWEQLRALPVPGLRPHGLGWNRDGRLWIADTSAGTVHAMDPETGRIPRRVPRRRAGRGARPDSARRARDLVLRRRHPRPRRAVQVATASIPPPSLAGLNDAE